MFKDLGSFLMVDLTFLLGGCGAADIFVVGGGAASTFCREDRVVVFIMFEDEIEG